MGNLVYNVQMTSLTKNKQKTTFLRDISELSNAEKIEEAKKILSFNDEENFKLGKRLLEAAQEDSEAKIGLAIILHKRRKFSLPNLGMSRDYIEYAYFVQLNPRAFIPLINYFGYEPRIYKQLDLDETKEHLEQFYKFDNKNKFLQNCIQSVNSLIEQKLIIKNPKRQVLSTINRVLNKVIQE